MRKEPKNYRGNARECMAITAGHSSAAARTSTREAPSVEEIPVEYSDFLENDLKDRNCRNE